MFRHPLLYIWTVLAVMFGIAAWLPSKAPVDPIQIGERAGNARTADRLDGPIHIVNYKADCRKKEEADLCAQQRMAVAAESQAADARLSVILLFLTFGAATWAAWEARKAAMAAGAGAIAADVTNKIVARGAALELRAYLSVLPAGINHLIGGSEVMGHVAVRNVGKLPARDVWVEVRMRIGDRDDRKSVSLKVNGAYQVSADPKQLDGSTFLVDRTIQPDTEMRQGCREGDVLHIVEVLNHPNQHIYVWGVVYYDDGTKRSSTRFRHRYAIASYVRRDKISQPVTEAHAFIEVDKARFHPIGNSAD
jgi:hypothetical protein